MCIDNVEIWLGVVNGQISSNFYGVTCPQHNNGRYYSLTFLFIFFIYKLPDAFYQVPCQLAQGCRRSRLLKQIVDNAQRTQDDGH